MHQNRIATKRAATERDVASARFKP